MDFKLIISFLLVKELLWKHLLFLLEIQIWSWNGFSTKNRSCSSQASLQCMIMDSLVSVSTKSTQMTLGSFQWEWATIMVQAQWSLGWENILLDKIQDSATTNYKNLKSSGYDRSFISNACLNAHHSFEWNKEELLFCIPIWY